MEDIFNSMDRKTKVYCVSFTSLILLMTICIAMSFGSVEPTEYGILYNGITKQIDQSTIYEGGLQYIGLWYSLVTFPRIHKTIEFSDSKGANSAALSTRTNEGLELKVHFSFQYQLNAKTLPNLYKLVGEHYDDVYQKIARDIVLQQAGEYPAIYYWQNRTWVGTQFKKALNEKLYEAFANCTGLMLLKIDLPDTYEGAIVDTQVVYQEKNTQESIMKATLIRTNTSVLKSEAEKNITILNAEATSNATRVQIEA